MFHEGDNNVVMHSIFQILHKKNRKFEITKKKSDLNGRKKLPQTIY